MSDVEWYIKHAGDLVPVCGFEVICWRCTGGVTITVPADGFDLAGVMRQVEQVMVRTPRGWLCVKCARNVGVSPPVQVSVRRSGDCTRSITL